MGFFSSSWFSDATRNVPWLHFYVGFSLTVEAFEQYLNYRQLRKYGSTKNPPAAVKSKVSDEEFAQQNAYNKDKLGLSIISSIVGTGVSLLSTVYFFGPYCWRLAGSIAGHGEYAQPLAFVAIQKVLSEFIATPFQLYSDFVVEEKHGFNKKTAGLFIKDKLLELGVTAAIGAPILCAVNWLVKWGGENFHFWLWGFSVLTTFGMLVIYPNLIAPLFNKFDVLRDKELRTKIDQLAAKLDFPLREVYEMDGSKRSSHSNAYFYGFWRWKRIVIFDTLLHLPHDQILAVLGHELGHWQKSHMPQRLAIAFLNLFATFYLYGKVMNNDHLYKCFGYGEDARSPVIGLVLLGNILAPINTIMSVLSTLLSRKHEFQADAFACDLNYGPELKDALFQIHAENKATLDPDSWYSWWHYSHPPLLERMAAIDAILKKEEKDKKPSKNEHSDPSSRPSAYQEGTNPAERRRRKSSEGHEA